MEQTWFEMKDIWARKLNEAVWIPIRCSRETIEAKYGYLGYKSELFAVSSVAVPLEKKTEAEKMGWRELSMNHHECGLRDERYVPADVFEDGDFGPFIPLVVDQSGNGDEPSVWHLHQDLVVALALFREGDVWVAMNEGYLPVARLLTEKDRQPSMLEIRAEFLKDYLCARRMALYVSSYRSRREIQEDRASIKWTGAPESRMDDRNRWEGRVREIHEGGHPFGAGIAVAQLTRTGIDKGEDVPRIPVDDGGAEFSHWTRDFEGSKLYEVEGELWRTEWVEPAAVSPRVRGDEVAPSIFFVTDSSGKKENADTLVGARRWLWFRPEVITELLEYRGSWLRWHTRDTARVRCSPADQGVAFGVNRLGMVNVYAKDIGMLPEWQQRLWAGSNVSPDGGVSEELLAAQAEGKPAGTRAPEEYLPKAVQLLNDLSKQKFGFQLFRPHDEFAQLLRKAHRFRSIDRPGLLSLAKDLARMTADSIDATAIQKFVPPPAKDKKLGSLKSLEKLIAFKLGDSDAYQLLSPLQGAYNLRMGDAHLPGSEIADAFQLAGVDESSPFVEQGYQLLDSCVSGLYRIAGVLKQFDDNSTTPLSASPKSHP